MDGRLWIVSGKPTRAAAEYLESRIDEGPLPCAGEHTGLWSVREYLKGADGLAPEDALVFVGAADAWAGETAGGDVAFDQYGMRCVLRGRRALLTASEKPILGRKEKRAFLAWLREACPELGAGEIEAVEAENKVALFDSLRAAINPFSMVLEQQIAPPPSSIDLTELETLQYRALALVFARDIAPGWIG